MVMQGTLTLLWRLGIDVSGAARRFREAVLRPYAADLASIGDMQGRLAAAAQASDDLGKRLAEIERESLRHGAEIGALRAQIHLLERLLTRGRHARPPGAAATVAALGVPAVAVIMPTLNRHDYIGEAIGSLLAQSFPHWELVIIADGPQPQTEQAVTPFLADPRIRYITQERAGGAAGRNRGIAETSAPLLCYLDDDNLYFPDFLAAGVDALATSPDVDLVYGALVRADNVEGSELLLMSFDRARLEQTNYVDTNVMMHRRSLVERHGGWDSALVSMDDWDLVLRYTAERPARALDALAVYYRECDDQRVTRTARHEVSEARVRQKWPLGDATSAP